MKVKARFLIFGIFIITVLNVIACAADGRATSLEPSDLQFRKFFTGRNLFDSEIELNNFDLESLDNQENGRIYTDQKLRITNVGDTYSEQVFSLGEMTPYSVYDLSITEQEVTDEGSAAIGISWRKDNDNWITVKKIFISENSSTQNSNTQISLQVKKEGEIVLNKILDFPSEIAPEDSVTIRAHWAGQYLAVWLVKDGKPYFLETEDISIYFDMRDEAVFSEFIAYLESELRGDSMSEISEFRNYYSGGDGQADPKPLHYKDGSVMIEDGKMWIAMTLRGYEDIPSSCQGIYTLDLETYELELKNITTFRKADSTIEWGYHASDFCYDEDTGKWLVVTTSHGDDKMLRAGVLPEDPRNTAYITVDVDALTYIGEADNDYEDPSVIYDEEADKWRIATCCYGEDGYNVALLESDEFMGDYSEIALYESESCTGVLIQKVGDDYYVFTGRSLQENGAGAMNLEALNYPELTLNCSLDVDGETDSYNSWPVIFSTTDENGETVYRMLSFDRDSIISNDGSMKNGEYTYGRIYMYEATETEKSSSGILPLSGDNEDNTKEIATAEELKAIREDLSGNYVLVSDIDLSGEVWDPIGTEDQPFSGTLDGGGYTITGLTVESSVGINGSGLFGYTAEETEIKNIVIKDGMVNGNNYTGILSGYNRGTISDCRVSGTVTGESETGILVGRNSGTITRCSAEGTVSGTGNDSTGGLVGANSNGVIEESQAKADVTGRINVGGLAGYNDRGIIDNTYAEGRVTGKNYVGGLVGASSSSGCDRICRIENSYADSIVQGNTAGGLVGFNDKQIINCHATGTVTGDFVIGGLVGKNNQYGDIQDSYTDSIVSGDNYVGLIIGKNVGCFSDIACEETGIVIGNSVNTVISDN